MWLGIRLNLSLTEPLWLRDSITLTGKFQETYQTLVTGMGWVRVTNSQPVPAPTGTRSTNP